MNSSIKISLLYFTVVFSAGFVFGVFRVLFLVDAIGARSAELAEMPAMLIVCGVAARYFILQRKADLALSGAVVIGMTALMLLLMVELTFVLWLRNISIEEYISSRDPVAGIAYLISLLWYAVAPAYFYVRSSAVKA